MDSQVLDKNTQLRHEPSPQPDLANIYYRWFDIAECTTPEAVRTAQSLRYQVYCVETHFLNAASNPGGYERDSADLHSISSLLIHKPSGMAAGTVRLILPNVERRQYGLPAYAVSPALDAMDEAKLPRMRTAEISRFAISKEFRRRMADTLYPAAGDGPDPLPAGTRMLPSIAIGLMRAIVTMTRDSAMTHVVSVTEPALERLLRRMGILFTPTGEKVAYHGTRLPAYRDMTSLLAEIHARSPDVWEAITDCGRIWPLDGQFDAIRPVRWLA